VLEVQKARLTLKFDKKEKYAKGANGGEENQVVEITEIQNP